MNRNRYWFAMGLIFALPFGRAHLATAATVVCDPDGVQESGAIYRICMPPPGAWNGQLVVHAHGYVEPNQPVAMPEDQLVLPNGVSLPEVFTTLGFAFATTSYSTNGLAVREGLADVVELVNIFIDSKGIPDRIYLFGISEGALITALAVEQFPEIFDGGLALCGPIGDFQLQINYFCDFRVIFDVYFPRLIPGSPVAPPAELMDTFEGLYGQTILPALARPENAWKWGQIFRVTRAPYDPANPIPTGELTIHELLRYNVFATRDFQMKLGGQSYDNSRRYYTGSFNDPLLNAIVPRFRAEPAALAEIAAHYQTSGKLMRPLVTMHNTLDRAVPYSHETIYHSKALANGAGALHINIPVNRYGHVNMTIPEVLLGFSLLISKATELPLAGIEKLLSDDRQRSEYQVLLRQYAPGIR